MNKVWHETSVGEILRLEYGKPLDDQDRKPNGRFPVYGANGEKGRTDRFYHDKPSIVVGRKGSAGELNLTEPKFWPLDVTYFVTFDERQHDLRFLYYLLTTLRLTSLAKGVKPGINRNDVYALKAKVPSLAEQQRIVGLLDEAFAGLAKAQTHAVRNLQNARALFESYVESTFTKRGNGWTKKPLIEACELFFDSAHRTPKYEDNGTPALRPRDVVNGHLNLAEALRVTDAEYETQTKRYKPCPGDVVYSRELSFGWAAVLPDSPRVCLSQGMCVFRPASTLIPAFLVYILNGSIGRKQAIRAAVGAAHPHINLGEIKSYVIPIPPLPEQKNILAKLDALTTEIGRLESIYQRKQAALVMMKDSLLHLAFGGDLKHEFRESQIIPFPAVVPSITTTDLHAGILAMAYRSHEKHDKQDDFGHVKAEKIIHLVEALVGIDLGRTPAKDAAGPNDFSHLRKVEHRAKMANYFLFQRANGAAYRVTKYPKFDELIIRTECALGEHRAAVDRVLELMWSMTSRQAEIFATVFAAWNNLLLDGAPVSDERIVQEARENWHPDKLKIPRDKFFRAIVWMKEKGVCPVGKGKKVLDKVVKKRR